MMGRRHDPRRHYLPFDSWPKQDQRAWTALFLPGSPLDEGGTCAHWAAASIGKRRRAYGHFLTYVTIYWPQLLGAPPLMRIIPEVVHGYRLELEQLVAPRTAQMRLVDLLCIADGLDPTQDWRFLRNITNAMHQTALPVRDKPARVVHSAHLFELGMDLIDRGQAVVGDGLAVRNKRAILIRDGLAIALLAARPLRMRNFSGLEIDRTFLSSQDGFRLVIPAAETKTKRPIEFDVPDVLAPGFRSYLNVHRDILRQGKPSSALWITYRGSSMTAHGLYIMITYRTRKAFGRALNPHMFRDAAATSLAVDDPDNIRVATSLLGHGTLAMTLKHYNLAQMLTATRVYQEHLGKLRKQTTRDHPRSRRRQRADAEPS